MPNAESTGLLVEDTGVENGRLDLAVEAMVLEAFLDDKTHSLVELHTMAADRAEALAELYMPDQLEHTKQLIARKSERLRVLRDGGHGSSPEAVHLERQIVFMQRAVDRAHAEA